MTPAKRLLYELKYLEQHGIWPDGNAPKWAVDKAKELHCFSTSGGVLQFGLEEVIRMQSAQLAEAQAALLRQEREYILPMFRWAELDGLDLPRLVRENAGKNCCELYVAWLKAERDRLKVELESDGKHWQQAEADLAICESKLEAATNAANARVAVFVAKINQLKSQLTAQAGELAEMGRERHCVPDDPNSPLIVDELQARLTEAESYGDTLEHINSEILHINGKLTNQLAALSTPAPCGVEGHTMAHLSDEHLPVCETMVGCWNSHDCLICAAYAKGQEKMRELAEKLYRDVTGNSDEPPDDRVIEKLRVLPVTGLADGGK